VGGQLQQQAEQVAGHGDQIQELARQGQDHRDVILSIEKSLRDKAAETDQELKSFQTSSREDVKNIRKYIFLNYNFFTT
jgi:hypothetical protein